MNLVKPSIEFLNMTPEPLKTIEIAGRTCYKSEDKIGRIICPNCLGSGGIDFRSGEKQVSIALRDHHLKDLDCKDCGGVGMVDSSVLFVRKIISRGHLAMIEHAWMSYRVICDRGVTHEIVRHRLFSYAQESTRYCDYKNDHMQFIEPPWLNEVEYYSKQHCLNFLEDAENLYKELRQNGWSPQEARSILPNALKTEIVITGNLREWLHFFKLRTAKAAHPQMQEIANMLLIDARSRIDVVFEDLSKGI